jgi:putative tricarboxylic transport membrane protein
MNIVRFVLICTLLILVSDCGGSAPAQNTMTLLAPAAPGGGWDQTARAMQAVFRSIGLAPTAQVINVPGAGGVVGLARVVTSYENDPNILMMTGLIMMGAIVTNNSPVTLEQVTPIARLLGDYEVLVVPADSPYRTLEDFVMDWKTDPGAFAIAGGSAGGADHMLAGLLAVAVGIDVRKINYLPHSGGGESLASLLGSHVAAGINGYAELFPFIETGLLIPLAISSEVRMANSEIPTFKEQNIDLSLTNWRGVAAPPGITEEERSSLVNFLDRMHASEEWQEALKKNSWIDLYLTGSVYEDFLKQENARVLSVLQSIGLVN